MASGVLVGREPGSGRLKPTGTWVGVQAWATPGCAEQPITRPRGGGLGLTSRGAPPLGQSDWPFSVKPAPCPIPLVSHLVRLRLEDRLRPATATSTLALTPNTEREYPLQIITDPTGCRTHLTRTLQRPSQIQTPTDVSRNIRKPYPETLKEIPQTLLKEVSPLGLSSPGPIQRTQETLPTREVIRLLLTLRLLGVPVALVTDPFSPHLGSRGFSKVPSSSALDCLFPPPSTLPQDLARAF